MNKKKDFNLVLIESGKNGKHITDFLIELEMSYEEHLQMLETNSKYKKAFNEYQKLCENYWFNLALNSMTNSEGARFNSRLWSMIMKNKFSDKWSDSSKVDLTSQGQKINSPDPIKIEIIKNSLPN